MSDEYSYRVRSPGRVNLIGEHTDYTGGYVLPMATDLHTQLEATSDDDVTVYSAAFEEQRTFSTTDRERNDDWTDYVKGCYAVLEAEGYRPGGFRGELSGDLPLGSGLSSSASLELAVMAFLNEAYDLGLSRERLAELSQRVENDFVGVSCGIMDQFAVALGEANHALYLDTGTLAYETVPFPEDIQVVVFHTGVERELVDSAYNQRRETVEAAMETLGVDSSVELEANDLDGLTPSQRQRLGYVVRENDRVERAVTTLERGDIEAFGDVLVKAHHDIAENYEASCPELDHVVETAVRQGAYGARLTGAGWGGAAIALVDTSEAETFAQSLREEYEQRFPEHDPAVHLIAPSDGVSVSRM
ncbi:galactokinase [Halapricum desulfuricans]|uniref:Galactokinase n=1 Tax=Halapricum desulfuricans TaxID=2841257 RepID=A0A897N3B0_9EURY|nr:galactokinase [Halapricum desulfuricans]QSG04796.1 Galactokinase [Halapricum desulfuricans]